MQALTQAWQLLKGIAKQLGKDYLAIWQDATAEAVAFGLVCCLDNCCQAVIGVSAGG